MEYVLGSASVRHIGGLAFPTAEFVSNGSPPRVLAQMGRDGWFRVFFGRGRKVELPRGEVWRIRAMGSGRFINPVVTSPSGKLAVATPHGKRSYGINGRDYAYNMYPTGSFGLRRPTWMLREHETELATLSSDAMYADHSVPLAAALLCFTVIKYGVPGEATLTVPELRWS